jgi:toxin YoeB
MDLLFTPNGWQDYLWWLGHDRQTLKRLNRLIEAALRTPFEGIGKPEVLRHKGKTTVSRRLNDADRLVYEVGDDRIIVLSARYHYQA